MLETDNLTADIEYIPAIRENGLSSTVGTMKPLGKENVVKCIKNIGQYIIDNAEKISENIKETFSIDIDCNLTVDALPEVKVTYTKRISDASMISKG